MLQDRIRLGALFGLGSSLGFLVLYLVAMAVNPAYRFGSNYLSDLGDTSGQVSDVVANPWPFNLACMVGGALAIPFAFLSLRPLLPRSLLSSIGIAVLMIAALFLILVGVFNESFRGTHGLVTVVFFLGMVIALALLSRPMLSVPAFGKPMLMLNFITLVLCFAFVGFGAAGVAPPFWETIAVVALVLWECAASANILMSPATGPVLSSAGTPTM